MLLLTASMVSSCGMLPLRPHPGSEPAPDALSASYLAAADQELRLVAHFDPQLCHHISIIRNSRLGMDSEAG